MRFYVLVPFRNLLMQLWGAALNGRTSTKDRIYRYRCRMFPCAIHTTNSHSQSTAYWQFLDRQDQPHPLNSSLLRLYKRLSAIDTEVINERGDSAVGVARDVKVFMDQKVVSACLP